MKLITIQVTLPRKIPKNSLPLTPLGNLVTITKFLWNFILNIWGRYYTALSFLKFFFWWTQTPASISLSFAPPTTFLQKFIKIYLFQEAFLNWPLVFISRGCCNKLPQTQSNTNLLSYSSVGQKFDTGLIRPKSRIQGVSSTAFLSGVSRGISSILFPSPASSSSSHSLIHGCLPLSSKPTMLHLSGDPFIATSASDSLLPFSSTF